jgi:hypothetical protein
LTARQGSKQAAGHPGSHPLLLLLSLQTPFHTHSLPPPTHTQYCQGDFILHLDSDVVLFRPVLYKDIFLLGKPMLEYDTYANLAPWHVNVWQNGTAFAVGRYPNPYEYSRSNEHVYPRAAYAAARRHIEERFNGLPFVDFLATRPGSGKGRAKLNRTLDAQHMPAGETEDRQDLFSDFNYMGEYSVGRAA